MNQPSCRYLYLLQRVAFKFLFFSMLFILGGCASIPSVQQRQDNALYLAQQKDWMARTLITKSFSLQAFGAKKPQTTPTLTIYLEGDGLAWLTPTTPSGNPTPINPLALKLALKDASPAVYLARPCQYLASENPNCQQKYWTGSRFAPEIIDSVNQGIEELKHQYASVNLILVGYSGGGAVAALVAAKRQDVIGLITIAGNLDIQTWTNALHLTPLKGSLNPADYSESLKKIPQWHFVGGRDKVIPPIIANAFADRFPKKNKPNIQIIPSADHYCCWDTMWSNLKDKAIQNMGLHP